MTVEAVRPNPGFPGRGRWHHRRETLRGGRGGASELHVEEPRVARPFSATVHILFKVSDVGNSLVVQRLGVWSSVLSPQVQVQSEGRGSGDTHGTQGRHSLQGCDDPARLLFCRGHSKGIAQPSPRLPWAQLCPRKSSQSQCGLLGFQDTSLGPPGRPALFFEWSGLFLVSRPRLKGTPSPLRKHGPVRSQQAAWGADWMGLRPQDVTHHTSVITVLCSHWAVFSQSQQAGRGRPCWEPVPGLRLTRPTVSSVRTRAFPEGVRWLANSGLCRISIPHQP